MSEETSLEQGSADENAIRAWCHLLGIKRPGQKQGPSFCSTERFCLYYFADGGWPLAALEERTLLALQILTRRAELREKSSP